MASKTLTMTNSWCSGTLATSQSLSSDCRTVTITATLKVWRNDGGTSYNYSDSNNFWVTIDGTTTYFTITSVAGTSGVSKSASKSVSINADGTKSVTVSCGGGLTETTFSISGTQSLTHTVTGGAKATYTISYNANGGSGAPSSQTKTYGTALTLSSTKPTKSGYNFLGWSTSSTATSATYTAGGSYTANSAATLYAVWSQIITYTITYNANGGSGAPSSQTKTHGTALTLSSTVPTRSQYEFIGWATSSSATSATYYPGGSYTANSAATLYAVWKSIIQTIKFYKTGKVQAYEFVESTANVMKFGADGVVTVCNLVESSSTVVTMGSNGTLTAYELVET